MKHITAAALAIGLALLASACSDPTPPVTPTPVPATITETFTGTLLVAGNNMIPFTVQQVGALKVSLTFQQTNTAPGGPAALSGTATVAGNFCVSIYDIGNMVQPISYTVTVQHS